MKEQSKEAKSYEDWVYSKIDKLEKTIRGIGSDLARCKNQCEGIECNYNEGIIPRCLTLEKRGTDANIECGCIIAGINPGICNKREMERCKQPGNRYEHWLRLWDDEVKEYRYFKRLRQLIANLGYTGPILWTDLAKCQNKIKGKLPPLQTFRTCAQKFLSRELICNKVIESWHIFAIGKEPYQAISYLYPNRTVIGVPHPSARGQHFNILLRESSSYKNFKKSVQDKAVWLNKETCKSLSIHKKR